MQDSVATQPSSPLGACRLVRLDMAPHWQCGWTYVARPRKKERQGNSLLYAKLAAPSKRAWPGSARGVESSVCPLPLEDVWVSGEFPELRGGIHEDTTAHFRPHPCPCNAPGARRRGYVVIQRVPERSGPEAIWLPADAGMAGPSPVVVGAL